MKDKIWKSFEEWFEERVMQNKESDEYQMVEIAKFSWNARNAEIQELEKKIEKMKNCSNCNRALSRSTGTDYSMKKRANRYCCDKCRRDA